jgi:hypothetical protein
MRNKMLKKLPLLLSLIVAILLFGISAAPALALSGNFEASPAVELEDELDQCLACHTDKDALVSSAKPEEAVESENEGEG